MNSVGVEVKDMNKMENLTNDRLHTSGDKALYPTFVNIGDKEPVEGTKELFVLEIQGQKRCQVDLKLKDGMLVDKKLNTKNCKTPIFTAPFSRLNDCRKTGPYCFCRQSIMTAENPA